MIKSRITLTLVILAAFSLSVLAQQSNTGEIRGFVVDEQKAAVTNAKVVVKNLATGIERQIVTDGRGYYSARLLQIGEYEITVEKENFKKWQQTGVVVQVGDIRTVSVTLVVGEFSDFITITGDAPIIETSVSTVGSVVGEELIENLPVNGRDYRDFVVLTPTADYSSRNGVTLGGSRGVQTNLTVDGFDSNSHFFGEQPGGEINPTFTISQESIKEFRVLNNGFSAEFGRSNGGLITMVTKSGTNEYRGSAFTFFQDESFVADQIIATNFGEDTDYIQQDEFSRLQFGGSLGGPIMQDKAFFFVSADIQQMEIPHPVRFDVSDSVREQYPELVAKEITYNSTNDNYAYLAKFDYQINDNHSFTGRWNYTKADQENGLDYYATNAAETQGDEIESQNNFSGALTSFFGDNMINELKVQYSIQKMERIRTNDDDLPQYQQSGYDFVFGSTYFLPIENDMSRLQVTDNFNIVLGDHDLKLGMDWNQTYTNQIFIGYWSGRLYFDDYEDYVNGNPYRARQRIPLGGRNVRESGDWEFTQNTFALYAQDKWQPTERLTIDYGIRWEGIYNEDPEEGNPLWPGSDKLYNDTNNFAPRLGLAYDLLGDGKTVVRAAAGLFHAVTPHLLYVQHFMENGVVGVVQSVYNDIPWPYDAQTIINRYANADYSGLDISVFDNDFEEAETWRFNAGMERELLPNTSISLDFLYAKGEKNQRRYNANLSVVDPTGDPRGETLYSRSGGPYPDLGAVNLTVSNGEMEYFAFSGVLKSRISERLTSQVSYTWSRDKDDDSNERNYSDHGITDPLHPDKDFGLSNRDRTHRLVASFVYTAPVVDVNIGGIFIWQSGRPYSAIWGTDLNGDGQYTDRAEPDSGGTIWAPSNSYRVESYKNFDLRLSKFFDIGRYRIEGMFEAFNVFNWESVYSVNNTSRYSSFGLPSSYQYSRRLQIGARLTF